MFCLSMILNGAACLATGSYQLSAISGQYGDDRPWTIDDGQDQKNKIVQCSNIPLFHHSILLYLLNLQIFTDPKFNDFNMRIFS